jgi:hypothetical protein
MESPASLTTVCRILPFRKGDQNKSEASEGCQCIGQARIAALQGENSMRRARAGVMLERRFRGFAGPARYDRAASGAFSGPLHASGLTSMEHIRTHTWSKV